MAFNERDKRALKLAGTAAALFLLFQFGAFPIWDRWEAAQVDLPAREEILRKYRSAVETAPARGAESGAIEARLREAEAGLLTGNTPAIASAELRQWVQQIASEQSVEIRGSEFLPAKPLGTDYLEVPLGVQFQCRLDSLVRFFQALDASSKALTVNRWSISGGNNKEKTLTVSMTVAGIARSEPAVQGKTQ